MREILDGCFGRVCSHCCRYGRSVTKSSWCTYADGLRSSEGAKSILGFTVGLVLVIGFDAILAAQGAPGALTEAKESLREYAQSISDLSNERVLKCSGRYVQLNKAPMNYGAAAEQEQNVWIDQPVECKFGLTMDYRKFRERLVRTIRDGRSPSNRIISEQLTFDTCDGDTRVFLTKHLRSRNGRASEQWRCVRECKVQPMWYIRTPATTSYGAPIRAAFYNFDDFIEPESSLLLAVGSPDAEFEFADFDGIQCILVKVPMPVTSLRRQPATDFWYFRLEPKVELLAFERREPSALRRTVFTWRMNQLGQPAIRSANYVTLWPNESGEYAFALNPCKITFDEFEFIDPPPDFKWLVDIPPDAEIRDLCEESPIPTTMELVEQEQKAERRWWLLVLGIVLVAGGIIVGLVVRRWRRR